MISMDDGSASTATLDTPREGAEPGARGIAGAPPGERITGYRRVLGKILSGAGSDNPGARSAPGLAPLYLEPGEWVEVRALGEIDRTLDERRRHRGLWFMPEMEEFCGRRFRVLKRVGTIRLESTGEVRSLTDPTVLLEGAYCTGEEHEGCDRACLHMWREAWLRRVPGTGVREEPAGPASGA